MSDLYFQLQNGLRVYITSSHAALVVSLQAFVRVGSADERPEEYGIAHLLEHMMFKGTPTRGVGQIPKEIEGAGGDVNAYTSFDQTVYHMTLASRHFPLGLSVLADLVQNATIDADELVTEREVVIEEIRRCHDNPGRMLDQAMFKTVFQTHPYGRPVIGFEEIVRGLGQQEVYGFYKHWYRPDNMIIVVSGDVDPLEAKQAVQDAFTFQSFVALPTPTRTSEPAQASMRFVKLERKVQEPHLEMAFPIVGGDHPDAALLDLLAFVLGQGESSRLVQQIRNHLQLVNGIYCFAYTPREPGVFMVSAGLPAEHLSAAYIAILQEIHQLREMPIRISELNRARNNLLSDRIFERETVDGRARKVGYHLITFGDLEQEKRYVQALEAATPHAIQDIARRYFVPEHMSIGFMASPDVLFPSDSVLEQEAARYLTSAPLTPAGPRDLPADEIVSVQLKNGIRLLVRRNHAVPIVALRAAFLGGLRYETARSSGAFHLLSQLVGRGTSRRSAADIAHEVETLAGGLDGFSGRSAYGLRAEFLSQHLERGFELFAEMLLMPTFPEDELERMRRMTIEAIRSVPDHPATHIFQHFAASMFKRHPYRLPLHGLEPAVRRLTRATLKNLYRRFTNAGDMVLCVVGDVDPTDIEALVERYFGHLAGGQATVPEIPVEGPLAEHRISHISTNSHQLHMIYGWKTIANDHADRFAMDVLSAILSGQGGRLFLELRDKQGLAYSVSSSSAALLGEGYFSIYIGTDPSKYVAARDGILNEIEKLLQDGVSPTELDRARQYLAGSYDIDLQRVGALCANMCFNELYGLGADAYRRHPQRILEVTADDVLRVARQYFTMDRYVLTTLGPGNVPG